VVVLDWFWNLWNKEIKSRKPRLEEGIVTNIQVKVKLSCYRPGVAQWVGRGIALLFHDRGTRRG